MPLGTTSINNRIVNHPSLCLPSNILPMLSSGLRLRRPATNLAVCWNHVMDNTGAGVVSVVCCSFILHRALHCWEKHRHPQRRPTRTPSTDHRTTLTQQPLLIIGGGGGLLLLTSPFIVTIEDRNLGRRRRRPKENKVMRTVVPSSQLLDTRMSDVDWLKGQCEDVVVSSVSYELEHDDAEGPRRM
eukprot:scaffold34567_cov66-Cyclotella_meneghiniana.AAC.1